MEAKEMVFHTLKENSEPMKAGEIAEKSGLDKKEVDKAIQALKAEEVIVSPKRCFYTVK